MGIFRRGPSRPVPLLSKASEAHIAVGSLSGVAPSDIRSHLLIVVDRRGRPSMTGTALCPAMTRLILAEVSVVLARQEYEQHECGTEEAGRG